jgi:small-conductance mechanosensitive channel
MTDWEFFERTIPIGIWNIPISGILLFVVIFIGLLFIYRRIMSQINKRIILQGLHPHFFNGLSFMVKMILMVSTLFVFFYFLNVPPEYTILLASVVISGFTISSIKAINNYIAGIWILLIRPFSIGDYISLVGIEGIVLEISLNYTKILQKDGNITLIPNIECLRNEIVIYSISAEWFTKELDTLTHAKKIVENELKTQEKPTLHLLNTKIEENITEIKEKLMDFKKYANLVKRREKILDQGEIPLSIYFQTNRLIRYTFTMGLRKEPRRNAEILDRICRKWTITFGLRPKWILIGIGAFLEYLFIIMTPDPQRIISYHDGFVKEVYAEIYAQKE